jgi:Uma2 family endonuclease
MELSIEAPYLIVKPFVSEDEFYRSASEDSDWEYLDGRLIMHSPASNRHEDLFRFLLIVLGTYLDVRRDGVVRGSRYPMRLDPRWSPEPDLLVVRESRRHLMGPNRLEGPADLVIEIASESDPGLDAREKLPRYREAAIDEIWLINPFEQIIHVEGRAGGLYTARRVTAGRVESSVLPGFWIDAAWLWRPDLPSTVDCLRQILGAL